MSEHFDQRHGWVIRTSFRSGDLAWWGHAGPYYDRHDGLVSHRGNANFYADHAIALETARGLRDADRINDYAVERYERPRLASDQRGSSGRA